MPKLILMAAVWNEADILPFWIRQIEAIQPDIVIISEGCFDLTQPAKSTDGSDRIIADWKESSKLDIRIIQPTRKRRISLLLDYILCRNIIYKNLGTYFANIFAVFRRMHLNHYRHNQAMTFARMLRTGVSEVGTDAWFMTSDCDQFYSKYFVAHYRNWLDQDIDYLSGSEHTFLLDTSRYSCDYEPRRFNNLPIRFKPGVAVLPTRHFTTRERLFLTEICSQPSAKFIDSGSYYHFKILSRQRARIAYSVGGRREPTVNENELVTIDEWYWKSAPSYIQEFIENMP